MSGRGGMGTRLSI